MLLMEAYVSSTLSDRIRAVINEHAHLSVDALTLDAHADLFRAGLSSHSSMELMLAVEDAFDIEFPDAMLKRELVQSIAALEAAVGKVAMQTV